MDWQAALKAIAPTLATALGGPFAGLAVDFIGGHLNIQQPTLDKVKQVIAQGQLSGEQILQLKNAEQAFTTRMRELDIQESQLVFNDLDSARKRESAVKDSTPRILAYMVVGSTIVLGFLVAMGDVANHVTVTSAGMIGTVLGYLVSESKQVLSYYFGSSAGSDKKTEIMAAKDQS